MTVNDSLKPHDELTEAYTFKGFISVVDELLTRNTNTEFAIITSDVERFKVINDLFGMNTGDEVLRNLAGFWKEHLGTDAVVGRIGSDKFVCCCRSENVNFEILKQNMNYTVEKDGEALRIFLQAGVYFADTREVSVIKMCDRALLALNSIKGNHSEVIAFYSENDRDDLLMDQQLVSDMDRAIKEHEFFVVIQPVYDSGSGKVVSGEALVRWNHPRYKLLMPGAFIPVFEKNYTISKLDKFVWEETCRIISSMKERGNMVPISINVSRANIMYDNMVETIDGLVKKYDIPVSSLRIEITESAYIDDPRKLMNTIRKFKKLGYTVLMDDFGTGYSSLNLLRELDFDILKIDKSLIDEIGNSGKAGNVVASVIRMAKWLGMKAVAEGVEQQEQVDFLKNVGCDYIQGYFYSKPVSTEDFFEKCSRNIPVQSKKTYTDINLDNMIKVQDVGMRAFLNKLIGPLALYSCNGKRLRLMRVNEEYYELYGVSPDELFGNTGVHEETETVTETKVITACVDAYRTGEPGHVITARKKKDGWMWLSLNISYVGDKDNEQVFIFNIRDITAEQSRRNRNGNSGLYSVLRHIYVEIIEMDYEKGTLHTVYREAGKVSTESRMAPMNRLVGEYAERVVHEDSRELFINTFSEANMNKFFAGSDMTFSVPLHIYDKNGNIRHIEMTVVKNNENPGSRIAIVCTRLIED